MRDVIFDDQGAYRIPSNTPMKAKGAVELRTEAQRRNCRDDVIAALVVSGVSLKMLLESGPSCTLEYEVAGTAAGVKKFEELLRALTAGRN
jgi:hypothetical protein